MTDKIVNTNIEILGKFYPVRCKTSEIPALEQAAKYLNDRMIEVQESGKVINLERIAIISALNITHQYLELGLQKNTLVQKVHQRVQQLQEKLDAAAKNSIQTEMVYSMEPVD